MTELETAQEHLVDALRRLESAVMRRLMRSEGPEVQQAFEQMVAEREGLARDVSVLRSECDRLSAALTEMQRNHGSLRDVTSHVAQRIDGSIAEIDRLLEG